MCTAGPEVNFTTQELVIRESETADVFVPIIINRTGPDLSVETLPVRLQWLLESGEDKATFGQDFDLPHNESCVGEYSRLSCVIFAPWQTTAVLHVIIKRDQVLEANESFHLVLNSPYRVSPYGMKVTILESAPRKLLIASYQDIALATFCKKNLVRHIHYVGQIFCDCL